MSPFLHHPIRDHIRHPPYQGSFNHTIMGFSPPITPHRVGTPPPPPYPPSIYDILTGQKGGDNPVCIVFIKKILEKIFGKISPIIVGGIFITKEYNYEKIHYN